MYSPLFILVAFLLAQTPASRATWQPVGLSGGGAMFGPAISPVNAKLMMLHCDMSAAYVTQDGGASWQMIPYSQLRSNTRCQPVFHPTDANTIYSASGWDGKELKISRDAGETWSSLHRFTDALHGPLTLNSADPQQMLVGADNVVERSLDAGQTWKVCPGLHGFVSAAYGMKNTVYVATAKAIWRSDDAGETWSEKTKGLPGREVKSFAGATDRKTGKTLLYCTVESLPENGRCTGGIYRSRDQGESWESAAGPELNLDTKAFDQWAMGATAQYFGLLASDTRPETVWVFNSSTGIPPPHQATAFRSDDAGLNWRMTFYPDPRWKPCNVEKDYTVAEDGQFYQDRPQCALNPANPDQVLMVDGGRAYLTTNGGQRWKAVHTLLAPDQNEAGQGARWLCNGLVVTTTWNYYLDPFEPNRHYIAYTDIGLARSSDAGKSWQWWAEKGRALWRNTCYELAFDPETPGKIWGAFSDTHDIPNGNIIYNHHRADRPGGECVSEDFGATWTPQKSGLPAAPCTGVVVDPKSPKQARILYAGFFGQGLYKTTDGGQNWSACNNGLGDPSNMRVCRVQRHADGTLFALVTALVKGRTFQEAGVGLYRSQDAGGSWESLTRSLNPVWPKDFTVDPKDSRIIYLGQCDANEKKFGGLYRTQDAGQTWPRLAREGPEHFGAYLHPKHPGWIYMTLCEGAPGAGLWLSKDNGKTFQPMEGLPFANAMRVTFDPQDDRIIYVTTFGGSVWKGPAE